jgi:hypothetical protein
MMAVTKSKVSLDTQATCLLQEMQKATAACGPLLEPSTAIVSPQERHGRGRTTASPTTLVDGAVDSAKRESCPGNMVLRPLGEGR